MKKNFILGFFLCLIVLASIQLSKSTLIENALTDEFFSSNTILRIEEINNTNFTETNTSLEKQQEMKELLKGQKLSILEKSFDPLKAEYRIVSTSNPNDQIYIFVEENVIVFPHKSSRGYSIKNNHELIREVDFLLK
ncbi:hypothetical protein [Psychrobacillus psychrotolerans]|uniref:hypothetical protein n=1 Tax=Psychrobacillus psychrotolerans TaxID=126156 RepID=UPI003C74FCBF